MIFLFALFISFVIYSYQFTNSRGKLEKKNESFTHIERSTRNTEFIGQNDYGRIIEEARRNPGQQNWGDLDAAIEGAKRSYPDAKVERIEVLKQI